ncbi:hypothetical protein ABBQ38_011779 [Trebouxia sp. C0009 RCD-2024]
MVISIWQPGLLQGFGSDAKLRATSHRSTRQVTKRREGACRTSCRLLLLLLSIYSLAPMASTNSVMKFVVLALLVVCALHAVQGSEAASGGSDEFYRGRALKQNYVGCDGANVEAQCPSGFYYLCSEGSAAGGCRSQAEGPFPDADCQKQCHTT